VDAAQLRRHLSRPGERPAGAGHVPERAHHPGGRDDRSGRGLALGTYEVTPLEIAAAFTTFANLGVRAEPRAITAMVRNDGRALQVPETVLRGAASPQASYLVLDLLRDVVRYGTGAGIGDYGLRGDLAGKTGTTDEARDAWFIGAGLDTDRRWEPPDGLVREQVDPQTGRLAGWLCPSSVKELFIAGTEPTEVCEHGRRRYESWTRRLLKWFRRD
jgi:membrane carboxypeptidase/penicillin-binding protein